LCIWLKERKILRPACHQRKDFSQFSQQPSIQFSANGAL
jgi:hypothetical protein